MRRALRRCPAEPVRRATRCQRRSTREQRRALAPLLEARADCRRPIPNEHNFNKCRFKTQKNEEGAHRDSGGGNEERSSDEDSPARAAERRRVFVVDAVGEQRCERLRVADHRRDNVDRC
jgi:hypothetical protein